MEDIKRRERETSNEISKQLKEHWQGELVARIIDLIDGDERARNDPEVYFKGHNVLKTNIAALVVQQMIDEFPKITPVAVMQDEEHPDYKPTVLAQVPESPYITDYEVDGKALKEWAEKWLGVKPK